MPTMTYASTDARLGPVTAIPGAPQTATHIPARASALLLAFVVAAASIGSAQTLETATVPTLAS